MIAGVRFLQPALGIALLLCAPAARTDDWPQWRGPTRDGVWRETGIVETFPAARLTPLWRVDLSSGYTGPTVAAGRVYVMDRVVRTSEPPAAPASTSTTEGTASGPTSASVRQSERVHCFDSRTGEPLWTFEYDCPYRGVSYEAGPRASVTIDDGRAFALGTMGHLHCFDAADGRVLWKKDLDAAYRIEMPTWGIAAAPLVEENLLIVQVGGTEACMVAFDKATGREAWKALPDRAGYSAPIIIEQAGRRVLVCWTGDNICGLEPRSGAVLWKQAFRPRGIIMNVASPVFDGRRLFLTAFFDGAMMMDVDPKTTAVELVWRRVGQSEKVTDGLHSTISTPLLIGDYIYGVDSYGELRCLDAGSGERVWEDLTATPKIRWGTIHFVRLAESLRGDPSKGEKVWLFNERGELLIGRLSPKGFEEISRTKIIDPTTSQLPRGDGVVWSHPAFADRCVFARNDKELICVSVAAK